MRTLRALGTAGAAALLVTTGTAAAATTPSPPPQPKAQLTDAQVDRAVHRLDQTVADMMRSTGVPGISVAVVHDDHVIYLKGFGVRRVGEPGAIGPDTVFQLASVSKPITSTIAAGALKAPKTSTGPSTCPASRSRTPGSPGTSPPPTCCPTAAASRTTPGTSSKTSGTTSRTSWTTCAWSR